MASRILVFPSALDPPGSAQPAEIYDGTIASNDQPAIKLRIATGGAGQSGLIKALADAFIDDHILETSCAPFAVSWIKSDTTASFNHLADGTADLSITYQAAAEEIAIAQGIADRRVYAWRDHFMLVGTYTNLINIRTETGISPALLQGPKTNPANLTLSSNTTIQALFSQLFLAATASSSNSVRFLSRFDKSATNIKESAIWTSIGQTPWAHPMSLFYHIDPEFPYQALATAAKLQEYTLIDRGTWYGVEAWIREEMQIYVRCCAARTDFVLLWDRSRLLTEFFRWRVKTTIRLMSC